MTRPSGPRNFWDDRETSPEDLERRTANNRQVLTDVITHALSTKTLDASVVSQWHTTCLTGLSYVPDPSWLGAYRGSNHPALKNMGLRVGGIEGVHPHRVDAEVRRFFRQLDDRLEVLQLIVNIAEDKSRAELHEIASLAGWAHGEWVRIHPFGNGNGRTARLIANWVLSRFRLLPVVGIRPRPEHPYGPAAQASMRGDHIKMTELIVDLLENARG